MPGRTGRATTTVAAAGALSLMLSVHHLASGAPRRARRLPTA